ncbi:hypothetical protein G5I_01309 [Acromyrmex echinatior]|uniref:Uncharacterized protein n=1 Tax=Acromyrmex echinatior TaxID=103372 RepID=F4W799_ACREC|nr:hypothetical protein G5I_01309 [Acromyrmex echinatior]
MAHCLPRSALVVRSLSRPKRETFFLRSRSSSISSKDPPILPLLSGLLIECPAIPRTNQFQIAAPTIWSNYAKFEPTGKKVSRLLYLTSTNILFVLIVYCMECVDSKHVKRHLGEDPKVLKSITMNRNKAPKIIKNVLCVREQERYNIILCMRVIVYLLIKLWLEKLDQDFLDRLNQEGQKRLSYSFCCLVAVDIASFNNRRFTERYTSNDNNGAVNAAKGQNRHVVNRTKYHHFSNWPQVQTQKIVIQKMQEPIVSTVQSAQTKQSPIDHRYYQCIFADRQDGRSVETNGSHNFQVFPSKNLRSGEPPPNDLDLDICCQGHDSSQVTLRKF